VTFAIILIAIVIGATAQRVTGMGFALSAAPFLVLLLGPFDGVLIANLCGASVAAIVLVRTRGGIDWRRYLLIVIPALVGVLCAAYVVSILPAAPMEIGIAVLLIAALTLSVTIGRATTTLSGPAPAVVAGFTSGFMNSAAGVGGPAMGAYAVLTRWDQARFAATMQPYLLTISSTSFISKVVFAHGRIPGLDGVQWVLIAVALIAGLALGEAITTRISHRAARVGVIALAYLGGVIALIHGIVDAAR
jgi:uncharacterized membrane protein YfcA